MDKKMSKEGKGKKASIVIQIISFLIFFSLLYWLIQKPISTFKTNDAYPDISNLTTQKKIDLGGSPSQVEVGVYIRDIPNFDIVKGKFILDLTAWFKFDHRLVSLERIGKFKFDRATIIEKSKPHIKIEKNKIIARYDMRAEINTTLNYKNFPLDDHRINFSLTNYHLTPSDIIFKSSVSDLTLNPDIQTSGWECVNKKVKTGFLEDKVHTYSKDSKRHHPRIIFSLDFARIGIRHIITIIIPLLLIFFIATITLTFDPFGRNKANIIKISVAAITAVIAHRFIIDNMSPKTGYFMLSDYFFFFFLLGCGAILIINLFNERISGSYKNIITTAIYLCYIIAFTVILYPLLISERKTTETFDIQKFRTALKINTISRPLVKEIEANQSDKFIIFGDLNGSFSSIKSSLQELKNRKIINYDLEIIEPNIYFIVLGNAIGESKNSLKLLNILTSIMYKNPQKTIYLKGKNETNGYWKNFDIVQTVKNNYPLEKEMDKFFDSLSNILVIKLKNKNGEKICLAHKKINNQLKYDPKVKFILLGEKKLDLIKESKGLEFLGYTGNAGTWSLVSCPTLDYKKLFAFHYNTFAKITVGKSAYESTITLNYNNSKSNSDYKHTYHNPVFGYKLKTEKDILLKNIYKIGSTMSLTGVTGPLGRENKAGLETAILAHNTGKSNNLINPIIFDDGYVPRLALSNVKRILKEYSTDNIVIPTGTPTLSLYLDMVKSGKISVLFPYTGGDQFRKKEIKNIIHFRASYSDEIKSAINYLVKEYGIRNFAFFYQNDPYGLPIAQAAQQELKKLGIEKWIDLPHLRTQSDFKYLIEKVKINMPEAIGCFSSHFPTQEFINQLGTHFFSGRILFGVSFLYSKSFQKFLKDRGIGFVLSSVVPDPFTSKTEIAKEFRKNITQRGLSINTNSLEGYIAGSLTADAINKTESNSKEKIIEYFEKMNNYKFKGLTLTFNPETRDLSQPVWLRTLDMKWIKYKIKG